MREVLWLLAVVCVTGCAAAPTSAIDMTAEPSVVIDLPAPSTRGDLSLEEALARRRSVREYTEDGLRPDEMSQLLWAAQGVTGRSGQRTAPSAGALYPLELYVVTAAGTLRYLPDEHQLVELTGVDLRPELMVAGLDQAAIGNAAAVFVIAGVVARTEVKYGDRAERYVTLEAGHAAQNLLLEAVALGLGAVPIGAFRDDEVRRTLSLPDGAEPLYLIPVGRPAAAGG